MSQSSRGVSERALAGVVVLVGEKIAEQVFADFIADPGQVNDVDARNILVAAAKLCEAGRPVDEVTLVEAGATPLSLEVVGAGTGAVTQWREYARAVVDEIEWANDAQALREAKYAAEERDRETFDLALGKIGVGQRQGVGVLSTAAIADGVAEWLQDETVGIRTPWPQLDRSIGGGLRAGQTTVVAAWSSMGKSAMVSQIAHDAVKQGATACELINEMSDTDRALRIVARMTGIPYSRIYGRTDLTIEDHRKIQKALGALPYEMLPVAGWSAERMARAIRRHKWDVWVVDLATRIPADSTSDWDRVASVLTDVALQTGTHGILVCQLNRNNNKGVIKPPPVQGDLRNTGSWWDHSTNVLFLHRDQDELRDAGGQGLGMAEAVPEGHIRADKHRHGPGGVTPVLFNAQRMEFTAMQSLRVAA